MKVPLTILFSFFVCFIASAQTRQYTQVLSEPLVDSLIERNTAHNKEEDGISGFRIQLYSDANRKGAEEIRTKFLQLYPDVEAYLIYNQPNFRVRIGDFRNKEEAHALYKKMLSEFKEVIIVPDKIKLPKL